MTEIPIVCSFHIFPSDYDGVGEYPSTIYSAAESEGWRTIIDSMNGSEVWICPECVERAFIKKRDRLLRDAEKRHLQAECDIWNDYRKKYRDEGVRSFREVCDIIDAVRKEFGIKSPYSADD